MKAALPEAISQDDFMIVVGTIFFRSEISAEQRLHAQQRK